MKHYLAIYTGTPQGRANAGWDALDDATRRQREQDGLRAWHAWVEAHQAHIVDAGAPLGPTLRIGPGGTTQVRNALVGYTVVRADSHADAAAMFEGHPHFSLFPGDAVEVMECLPIPGR